MKPREDLYTIVFDFAGGTYLAQVRAPDAAGAVARWAGQLARRGLPCLTRAEARELARDLPADPPVPVEGLVNTWCSTGLVGGRAAFAHIVRTAEPVV